MNPVGGNSDSRRFFCGCISNYRLYYNTYNGGELMVKVKGLLVVITGNFTDTAALFN